MTTPDTPTANQLEKLRLLLSTFQDGTGMLILPDGRSAPGWRDFERAVAIGFGGSAQESKAIFDVLVPISERSGIFYGISCKMRRTLDDINRTGKLTVELSNSNKKFWQHLRGKALTEATYRDNPAIVGMALVELIARWHQQVSIGNGGRVDLAKSS